MRILEFVSTSHADVIFNVRALSSVYTQATGDDVTRDYLEELQEISRVSGKPFQLVIQEELRKLNAASSLIDLSPMSSDSPVAAESQIPQFSQSQEQVRRHLLLHLQIKCPFRVFNRARSQT